MTQDALVEGVDFLKRWITPYRLGRRALAVSLSDLAAMGSTPAFCLLTICARPSVAALDVLAVAAGLGDAAASIGCTVAGAMSVPSMVRWSWTWWPGDTWTAIGFCAAMRDARVTCSSLRDPRTGRRRVGGAARPASRLRRPPGLGGGPAQPAPSAGRGRLARGPGSSLRRRRQRRAVGRCRADRDGEQLWSGVVVGTRCRSTRSCANSRIRRSGPGAGGRRGLRAAGGGSTRVGRAAPDGLAGRTGAHSPSSVVGAGTRRTIAHRPGWRAPS